MAAIDLRIDHDSPMAPYEQVRAELAARISRRQLVVGTKLPTVRGLAAELGLAANTVARAYRELEDAGLVETHGRRGTIVSAAGDDSRDRARQAARQYATAVHGLGLAPQEALAIVRAALEE